MTAEQIYSLINDVAGDSLGANAVTVRSTADLVTLGDTVLSSADNTDNFYNKLVDRIGRVYIKYRRYVADTNDSIIKTPLEFGIILQKIQTGDLADATANTSWSTSNTKMYYEDEDTTDIEQKLFSKLATFQTKEKVIYDYQLKTAFINESNMGAFVNLIYNDMYNAMEVWIEETGRLAVATGIAQCLKSSNTNVKRNLLAEYKVINPDTTITSANCIYDVDFLRFATREINLATKRMQRMSTIFNPNKKARFTPADSLSVDILADFGTSADSYLMSDTYHNELVALPRYRTVSFWQGSGTNFAFADTSKISITDEKQEAEQGEEESPENTTQTGVLAYIHDKDAVGMMVNRIRVKTLYDPMNERSHVVEKCDCAYYIDSSENAVTFYVAD